MAILAGVLKRERERARVRIAQLDGYRVIVEQLSEGILVADADRGNLVEANPAMLRKLGYSCEELARLQLSDVLIDKTDVLALRGAATQPTTLARTTREVMQRGRDGSLVSVDVSVTGLEFGGRRSLCYVIRDATPRKAREDNLVQSRSAAERRAEYLAHRDPLTGLANRQFFITELHQALAERVQHGVVAVLLLDLNDFSSLNDTLGPHVGDAVLTEIANRLRRLTHNRGHVARVGSDEFAVALQQAADPDTVARVALEVQGALSVPMQCLTYEFEVTANVGVSLCSPGETDVNTLLRHADLALSSAKAAGPGSMRLFNSRMHEDERRRLEIVLSLRQALDRGELTIHYQPVVEIETRRVLSLEALVRWQHPLHGLLPPSEFIEVAERSGLIVPLGERVLRLVCEQIVRWRSAGVPVVPVAVNVSPQQFQHQSIAKLVQDVLHESRMAASDLAIEITEGSLMSGADRYAKELEALRAAGVRIMVDDFGTGYSSLSYLKHLPLDTLKIDRSFIANVDTSATDEAIVSAIVAMARSLGLKVVAEGVESKGQLAVLARHGCQMAQGYYFGRPLPADSCVTLLKELACRSSFTDTLRMRANGPALQPVPSVARKL